jgi:isorenieratene synthase
VQPDWVQANPHAIERSLARALNRPSGGWYVMGASRAVGLQRYRVDGRDLVAFRDADGLVVGADQCPHMGARVSEGSVVDGCLVCPWHGLTLDRHRPGWPTLTAYDDGLLAWVQLEPGTDAPILAKRPDAFMDGVIEMDVGCEPRDIIANRLDPWHGTHFHPYAFSALEVLEADEDELRLNVTYRVAGRFGFPVTATFHSPEPRTIVMTIVDGEGAGSVVETHATPIEPGRTRLVEATLATSERPGFRHAVSAAPAIRPAIRWAARRLWRDDARYAERLYELRQSSD